MLPFAQRFNARLVPLACSFVVVVCLAILAMDGWRTWRARGLELHESEIAATNLSMAIGQHVTDTLKQTDTILMSLVDRFESYGPQGPDLDHTQTTLARFASTLPQIERIGVFDERGHLVVASMETLDRIPDVSSREYFRHHAGDAGRDVFVGPPIRSSVSGQWVLTLSRRITRADGTFGGLVVATIELDSFRRFFDNLEIGKLGTLVLATKRGQLLERRPLAEKMIGMSLASTDVYANHVSQVNEGVLMQVSSIDHVERQIAFKNLDEYPLYVVASLATEETLAKWKADAITHTMLMALLLAALGISGFWIVCQLHSSSEANVKLVGYQAELHLLNRKFAAQAREDGLTGLANRRELDRVLLDQVAHGKSERAPLAFILLDIDCFKLFNDFYGHLSGDDCLREVANAVDGCVNRPGDMSARYGGEEFAVVLPGTDVEGATAIAQNICQAVRHLGIKHAASSSGIVTISAGVAVLGANDVASFTTLMRRADEALYSAKRNGRDRVAEWQSTSVEHETAHC